MIGARLGVIALSGGGINPDFVSTWDTTQAGSASDTVELPLLSGGVYSGTIDWGDGGATSTLSYANRTHVYASSGTYTITISGTIEGWQFNSSGDKAKITDVSNWGNLTITTNAAFRGCSNLDISATDAPIITTASFSSAFQNCTSLTTCDFSSWDVSTVTAWNDAFRNCNNLDADVGNWVVNGNLSDTFRDCTSFTGTGLDSWDTSGITYLLRTFYNADVQVSDLTGWDVSSVTYVNSLFTLNSSFNADCGGWSWDSATTLSYLFNGTIFNQDIDDWTFHPTATNINGFGMLSSCSLNTSIDSWDVSGFNNMAYMFLGCPYSQSLNSWDVSNVLDMQWMFRGGGNPNITSWDVSSVSNMSRMFQDNSSFNQNIGGWNTASLSNISLMLYNADSFDQNIGGWDWTNISNASSFMQLSTGLSTANYDSTLVGIEANLQATYPNGSGYTASINIHFGGSQYSNALMNVGEARYNLLNVFDRTITEEGGV